MVKEHLYYSVLGIDSSASANTVVKAYRQLALKHHPDKHPEGNSEQFLTILQAYEVLSDPSTRRLYDLYGPSLKPDLRLFFSKLLPLFSSTSIGFVISTFQRIQLIKSFHTAMGLQVCCTGVVGVAYCRRARLVGKNRDGMSVSDYATIAVLGLAIGNLASWITISSAHIVKSILS